jgi:FAD synthetase
MKTVMAAGTFDIFHAGHEYFLREAKKLGEKLIVVVARDSNVLKAKGKLPGNNEEKRLNNVVRSGIADSVVLGNEGSIFTILSEIRPDVICLGYDQKVKEEDLRYKLDKIELKSQIIRLNSFRPEIYKSSLLRNNVK